jgi:dipeptidyl aminopeptidase/acylaminoacyl peptidase
MTKDGTDGLILIEPSTKRFTEMDLSFSSFSPPYLRRDRSDNLWVIAGGFRNFPSIVKINPHSEEVEVIRRSSNLELEVTDLSSPESVKFPSTQGTHAFGFYYPPTHHEFQGQDGEKPPLIVLSHGGPTSSAKAHLQLEIQYWTNRGFGLVDVNYGGSTGYGRPYRERLSGNWGIVDVLDCINAAKNLIQRGLVDRERVAIRGKSAGGFTTLSAVTFHDFFNAGIIYYGVGDLKALSDETHKFEAYYLEDLVGSEKESVQIYQRRSPLFHSQSISCPLLIFQGLEDRIVPPSQATLMIKSLEKKGLPYAYIEYENEGHGFRMAENMIHSLEAEYGFLCRVFDIEPSGPGANLIIHNLDE